MLQQACNSICAALGVGIIIQNLGEEGTLISDNELDVVQDTLEPMKKTYSGSYWTTQAPSKERSWQTGSLLDPKRDGSTPLIAAVKSVAASEKKGLEKMAGEQTGQLLWAARGRTPHLYLSRPWGLTIPTAKGIQNRMDVVLCNKDGIHRYVNWSAGRPTHSIEKISEPIPGLTDSLQKIFPENNCFVLLTALSDDLYSLLEIGFMAQNILVQAAGMNKQVTVSLVPSIEEISVLKGKIMAVAAFSAA